MRDKGQLVISVLSVPSGQWPIGQLNTCAHFAVRADGTHGQCRADRDQGRDEDDHQCGN